jgi:hypothetical protein
MELPRDGIEYAHLTLSAAPPEGASVELEVQGTWHATLPGDRPTERKLLLRGPAAPVDASAVTVTASSAVRVRVSTNPERIIRATDGILLLP